MANLSEAQEFFVRTLAETLSETRKGCFVVQRQMIEAGWNNRTNSIRPAIVVGSVTCFIWSYRDYSGREGGEWYLDYGMQVELIWREIGGESQLTTLVELCAKANFILGMKEVLSNEEFTGTSIVWVNPDED